MNYPVATSLQLRAVLRALRQSRSLSQTQVGQLLGVSQKRVAAIERSPGVTAFAQIARLVAALGGRLAIEVPDAPSVASVRPAKKGGDRKAVARSKTPPQGNW